VAAPSFFFYTASFFFYTASFFFYTASFYGDPIPSPF
jgi:hypothetical protein